MRLRGIIPAWAAMAVLAAQPADRVAQPYVRATGEAVVKVKPDQATIDIGVVTQGAAAQEVSAQNAKQVDAVLAALRAALGSRADIKTISYSVSPNYRYPREGGQPAITGYTAANTVEVTTTDLALVGKVIDTAAGSGANNIQRLEFNLKNTQPVRAQALEAAAVQARANAEAIAKGLGLRVLRVLAAEEGTPVAIRPVNREMAMAAAAPAAVSTPVEAGTVELRATVTLRVEVGP